MLSALTARRSSAVLLALALTAGTARAHVVYPSSFERMRPLSSDYIWVFDPTGCTADVTVSSTNPDVKVFAVDMATGFVLPGQNGVTANVPNTNDQVFRVSVTSDAAPGNSSITVCWIGSTYPALPCPENNCITGPLTIPVTILDRSQSSDLWKASFMHGDPVNTGTGALTVDEASDLNVGGANGVLVARRYNSGQVREGNATGRLGTNWKHTYEWQIVPSGNNLEVLTDGGGAIRFEKDFFATEWTQASHTDTGFELVEVGSDRHLSDPRSGLVRVFDFLGRLIRIEDGRGNVQTLSYSGLDLTQVTDGLGRAITFGYTAGRLTSLTDGTRNVFYTYDGSGNLSTVTDVMGEVTTYEYDPVQPSRALLTRRVLPSGAAPNVQVFDSSERVVSQTNANAETTTFSYDSVNDRTTITSPTGAVEVHHYDQQTGVTQVDDAAGNSFTMGYDAAGQRTSITDRLGESTALGYDAVSGRLTSTATPDGATTTFGWTTRPIGALDMTAIDAVTLPDGTTETYTYDGSGRVTGYLDRVGQVTTYTYGARDELATRTNPAGGQVGYTYDGAGNLTSHTDEAGNVTTYTYGPLGRLQQILRPDGATVSYAVDAADRLTSTTDELGNTTTYTYDVDRNVDSVTYSNGATWTYDHDGLTRMTRATDPDGNAWDVGYGASGRAETFTDPLGNVSTIAHDAVGNPVSFTDALGRSTTLTYDDEGAPLTITDPLGQAGIYQYDPVGRPVRITTPAIRVTRYTYDTSGRPVRVVDGVTLPVEYTYSPNGPTQVRFAQPDVGATYSYDAHGNVAQAVDPDGKTWSYTYDDGGRRTTTTDPLGRPTTYQYGVRNELTTVTFPNALGSLTITRDALCQPTQFAYSDGTTYDYTYDPTGRPLTATSAVHAYDAVGRMTNSNGVATTYDDAGRMETVSYPAGPTVTYAYDAAGQLTSVTDSGGGGLTYQYDLAGRRTSALRSSGLQTTYVYDPDGYPTSIVDGTVSDIAITYDKRGFPIQSIRNTPLSTPPGVSLVARAYDDAGQVQGHTYDDLGRLTSDGTRTFTFNHASQLVGFHDGVVQATMTYDGFGNLLTHVAGGVTRQFVWNLATDLASIAVVREGGADKAFIVTDPAGEVLYEIDATTGARRFHHHDEAANTIFTTDDARAVVSAVAYTPYGEVAASSGPLPLFTFQGRFGVLDLGGGLHSMRARAYDSVTKRFLTHDPEELLGPLGLNPYLYAAANPLVLSDPRGEAPISLLIAAGPQAPSLYMALLLPAVQAVREAAQRRQCTNNLKEIALAVANRDCAIQARSPHTPSFSSVSPCSSGTGRWTGPFGVIPHALWANSVVRNGWNGWDGNWSRPRPSAASGSVNPLYRGRAGVGYRRVFQRAYAKLRQRALAQLSPSVREMAFGNLGGNWGLGPGPGPVFSTSGLSWWGSDSSGHGGFGEGAPTTPWHSGDGTANTFLLGETGSGRLIDTGADWPSDWTANSPADWTADWTAR